MSATMNQNDTSETVARAVGSEDESRILGRLLYRTRQRTGTVQQVLTVRTGVSQPNISAYESGRRQPTWPNFCRLMKGMHHKPVIEIVPTDNDPTPQDRTYLLEAFDGAIGEALMLLEGIPYRFEREAAAQLLGRETTPDIVRLSAVFDVEELAQRALGLLNREVLTARGGSRNPRVQFDSYPLLVSIELVDEPRESLQVVHGGRVVHVAGWRDIDNPRL